MPTLRNTESASARVLAGHDVVITGGSQGIGHAVAARMAGRCRSLTLLARDAERLDRAASALACDWVATDVRTLSEEATSRLAQTTLLVACAGEMTPGRVVDLDGSDYQRQIDINFIGTVNCVRAALPHMVRRGSGTIVLISSTAALLGIYGYSAYGATKAAVTYFAEALRAETAGTGVRIVVAYPPDTETPGLQRERTLRPAGTDIIVGTIAAQPAQRIADQLVDAITRGRSRVTFDPTTAALVGYASITDRIFQLYTARLLHRAASGSITNPSSAARTDIPSLDEEKTS